MREKDRDEVRVPKKELWTEKKARPEMIVGVCECCQKESNILLTDDGDFCDACMSKMSWMK